MTGNKTDQKPVKEKTGTKTSPGSAFVGLAGAGHWGANILRNLEGMGVLRTVCDVSPRRIATVHNTFCHISCTTSYRALLDDPLVTAVAIATPASTHYGLVKEALLSDKDVFVEKPLALTAKEGKELVVLAASAGKILMVGHVLHYHGAVMKLKEMVASGHLGRIEYIYSNRLNIGTLRTEENILWSFAPHDISVILMLMEEEPVSINAFGGDYLSRGIYDTTLTTMEFRNGVKGHIFVSWLHPYKEQKLVIVGSKGMALFDDVSDEKLLLYPHTIEWRDGKIPVAHKADYQIIPFSRGEPLKVELEHFIASVKTRIPPPTDGYEGLRVLQVLEAAEDQLRFHRTAQDNATNHIWKPAFFVHESALVDDNVKIAEGTKIWHFSHILRGSTIGRNCVIGQNVMIGPDAEVGKGCKIQNNVSIFKGVKLEDEVFCGPSSVFTNVFNPRAFIERKNEFLPTLVRQGATIGANATIVCGVTIGRYAMIAAGSVVKSDVPDHAMVAGVPARQKGWVCRCGVSLKGVRAKKTSTCLACGNTYTLENNALITTGSKA